jgi:hypothetical protein
MKFCKDCKWYQKEWYCYNPSLGVSLIDATPLNREVRYCRKLKTLCGPTAKWFEEKEKPIPKCEECRWNHPIGDHIPGLCERSTYCEYTVCVRGIETKCGKYGKWWEKKEVRSNDDYLDAFDSKPVRIEKALKPKKQSWLCRLICGGKK